MGQEETHPSPDLALPPPHDGLDVLLHGRRERRLVLDVADPAGELRVPDERMAADRDVALRGPVDEVVGLAPVVRALLVVETLPLHAVLGGDLAKVLLDDGGVLGARAGQEALVGGGTEIELALGLDELVDALRRLAGLVGGNSHGRQRRQEHHERGLHGECGLSRSKPGERWKG